MTLHYSAQTAGFYDSAIHGAAIPPDAVDITPAYHAELLAAQAQGLVIQPDATGHPVALPPPAPTLAELKAHKIEALRAACRAAIEGGASSSALGVAHTYPTDETSQLNLAGEVAAAILDGALGQYAFLCADGAGIWARRPHTDVEIKAVGHDVRAHVKAQLAHLDAQRALVAAAATEAEVNGVAW